MQLLAGEALGQRVLPFKTQRTSGRHPRSLRVSASSEKPQASGNGKEAIYIGHEKDDYKGRREGTQGRFVYDDPSKYPSRDSIGFFSNVTGGWAGGETALKEMLEEYKGPNSPVVFGKGTKKAPVSSEKVTISATSKEAPVRPVGKGDDLLYVGYSKDEDKVRKAGEPGRFIRDNAKRYPTKESIGFFDNIVGGFAGGEVGVKQFAEKGDLEFRPEGQGRRAAESPLIVAGIVGALGTAGGLLLTSATDFEDELVASVQPLAAVDDNTKLILEVAVVLIGVTGAVAGTRFALKKATESVAAQALKLGTIAAFWVVVFLAARFVIES